MAAWPRSEPSLIDRSTLLAVRDARLSSTRAEGAEQALVFRLGVMPDVAVALVRFAQGGYAALCKVRTEGPDGRRSREARDIFIDRVVVTGGAGGAAFALGLLGMGGAPETVEIFGRDARSGEVVRSRVR